MSSSQQTMPFASEKVAIVESMMDIVTFDLKDKEDRQITRNCKAG